MIITTKKELREKIRNTKKVDAALRLILTPYFLWEDYKFCTEAHKRENRAHDARFQKIKKYRNRHKDAKRCFIVATGPSLLMEDLETLREHGEICFSMNSIVNAFSHTRWRPSYYGVQDYHAYEKFRNKWDGLRPEQIFIGSYIKKFEKIPEQYVLFPHDLMRHNWYHARASSDFSFDCYVRVRDGYSIAYSMLQLAVYMGFKEIYLLGVDASYATGGGYYSEDIMDRKELFLHNDTDLQIYAFDIARKSCEEKQIRIWNATRGGKLEVFPRVSFDSLFTANVRPRGGRKR